MTPEGKLVKYIKDTVRRNGGHVRKCRWEGRVGAPDLLIMDKGRHFWVEVKAPGEKPRPIQAREHEVMRAHGCAVYVVDSEAIFNIIYGRI